MGVCHVCKMHARTNRKTLVGACALHVRQACALDNYVHCHRECVAGDSLTFELSLAQMLASVATNNIFCKLLSATNNIFCKLLLATKNMFHKLLLIPLSIHCANHTNKSSSKVLLVTNDSF